MGRFRDASGDDELDTTIDMSPLIDCVFILLIFFIVTTVFVDETGVEVDKPEAASAVQLEKHSLMFAITEKGQVVHDNKEIGVQGVRAIVERELRKEQMPVIIEADENATTGMLADVLDEAKLAGAQKISLATRR